ncbi:hypothetical protein JHD48_03685 [Sulfurimonas sp. SAG-AH-194-I05]|nr:hypothetical protein [Sulfurimonas sp. SAG-AH-194-I05]MDF1874837.1 hypothetical protein [Sulfurimonas sp. SAG-AH-194-I05]
MVYIVTALKPEAQAFRDKYNLQKISLANFKVFYNENMMLIISGLGVEHAMMATQTLINHYDITDDDIYVNIGICGANKKYAIGELLEIGNLHYKQERIELQSSSALTLTCTNEEITHATYDIVDMESFGFYEAVIHNPAIKHFHIFKVVSDHFEPQTVTKEKTKALVFNTIDAISLIIKGLA